MRTFKNGWAIGGWIKQGWLVRPKELFYWTILRKGPWELGFLLAFWDLGRTWFTEGTFKGRREETYPKLIKRGGIGFPTFSLADIRFDSTEILGQKGWKVKVRPNPFLGGSTHLLFFKHTNGFLYVSLNIIWGAQGLQEHSVPFAIFVQGAY